MSNFAEFLLAKELSFVAFFSWIVITLHCLSTSISLFVKSCSLASSSWSCFVLLCKTDQFFSVMLFNLSFKQRASLVLEYWLNETLKIESKNMMSCETWPSATLSSTKSGSILAEQCTHTAFWFSDCLPTLTSRSMLSLCKWKSQV